MDTDSEPPSGAPAPPRWVRRYRLDGARLAVAGVGLGVSTLLIADPPARWEESVFHAVNGLPHGAGPALWLVQQIGAALVVPVAAVVLWFLIRHWRPPLTLAAGGFFLGWLAARGMKAIAERGRPLVLFDDTQLGFHAPVSGVGFPSGHAVLLFTLATVFSSYVSSKVRWVLYGGSVLVLALRVYVGAHMPLDVMGGAFFGMRVSAGGHLAAGCRARLPSPVRAAPMSSTRPMVSVFCHNGARIWRAVSAPKTTTAAAST